IEAKLAADRAFSYNEVSVNLGIDGELVYCWAKQPRRRKARRFDRLVHEARASLPGRSARRLRGARRRLLWAVPRRAECSTKEPGLLTTWLFSIALALPR
ncbi:MAG TPA: hypothetical protein PK801_08385, partial [Aggregatilineales bacterium]|nr:hypothetical protein [Aggregatilineales bacterium]HQA68326.1 hypothetical protein [Aggregatilineales bacterium]HQE18909.1 hypothetical protein [Aggregatilineales bacterium]